MENHNEKFTVQYLEKESDPPLLPNDDRNFQKYDFSKIKHNVKITDCSDICLLLQNLINGCSNIIDKVASIFYWLSFIDKANTKFSNASVGSLESNFNQICQNICWKPLAFEFLCRCIGISCITIKGIVRTMDYILITNDSNSSPNHSWNCAFINNAWYLFDILWSSKVIVKTFAGNTLSSESQESDQSIFTNQYFLMPPIIFQTTHFPNQHAFQLLSKTTSFDHFESYPLFTIHFFESPLASLNYESYSMISQQGHFKLVLPHNGNSSFFHFLEYYDEQQKKMIIKTKQKQSIKSFSLIEITKEHIILYFRFPLEGNYFLTLCIQNEQEDSPSIMKYKALLKWRIQCLKTINYIEPFYGCRDMNLGPNWFHMNYYGLLPINLITGIVIIDFSPPAYLEACFTKLNPEVTVLAKVRGSASMLPSNYNSDHPSQLNSQCNGECLDWLIDDEDDTESEIIITIRLPKYGEYSLEIYANLPKEGDKFVQVAQYILDLKQNKSDQISSIK